MSTTDQNILNALQRARMPKAKKEQKPPRRRSEALKELFKGYLKQVKIFLSRPENLRCKIQMACNGAISECVHHVAGRTGAKLKDESDWMPACNKCNLWVEENDAEARKRGFKKTRMGKVNKHTPIKEENTSPLKSITMESTETQESILALTCTKAEKIKKLNALGKSNKEIAELVGSNQGHVWNVLNKKIKQQEDKIK